MRSADLMCYPKATTLARIGTIKEIPTATSSAVLGWLNRTVPCYQYDSSTCDNKFDFNIISSAFFSFNSTIDFLEVGLARDSRLSGQAAEQYGTLNEKYINLRTQA